MITCHRDVIDLFKPRTQIARFCDVPKSCVTMWRYHNNIPYDFWRDIVNSEVGRANGLTVDMLLDTAKKRKHWKSRG
jgi:hypothetical protein